MFICQWNGESMNSNYEPTIEISDLYYAMKGTDAGAFDWIYDEFVLSPELAQDGIERALEYA